MFSIGDYIYYIDKDGSHHPGVILEIHNAFPRIKIEIDRDRSPIVWVKPMNLKHQ